MEKILFCISLKFSKFTILQINIKNNNKYNEKDFIIKDKELPRRWNNVIAQYK